MNRGRIKVEADSKSLEGRQMGPYQVHRRLGRGAMGEVYLAHDPALDRPVALKVLRDSYSSDVEFVKRFQQEARAAARLSHPNIVQVHAVDINADPPYMVMEYIDGQPLDAIVAAGRKMDLDRALVICGQAAAALACAHAAGIIHRDIKPGNILLDARGRVRVSDFGIAKVLTAHTQLTMDNRSLGSPAYMSPEQCHGDPVSPASDLFSLGVTLFEMLTGRLPWLADTALAVMKKIAEEPLPPLADYVQVPAEIELFLETLTAKDPARRYQSATQVIADIQAFRAGKPMPHLAQLNPTAARIGGQAPQAAPVASAAGPGTPANLASNWYLVSGPNPPAPAPATSALAPPNKTLVDDLFAGTESVFTRPRPPEKNAFPWLSVAVTLLVLLAGTIAATLFVTRGSGSASPPENAPALPASADVVPAAPLPAENVEMTGQPIPAGEAPQGFGQPPAEQIPPNGFSPQVGQQPFPPPPGWPPNVPLPPGWRPGMPLPMGGLPPPPPPRGQWGPQNGRRPPPRGQGR